MRGTSSPRPRTVHVGCRLEEKCRVGVRPHKKRTYWERKSVIVLATQASPPICPQALVQE